MTMTPRQFVVRGRPEVVGLVFVRSVISDQEAVRRIVRLWEPTCAVYETPLGYLLRFSTARRLSAQEARGALLLNTVPPSMVPLPDEYESKRWEERTTVEESDSFSVIPESWCRGPFDCDGFMAASEGRAFFVPLKSEDLVDVSTWIDVDEVQEVVVEPVGSVPPPPEVRTVAAEVFLRKEGGIEALSAEGHAVFEVLQNRARDGSGSNGKPSRAMPWWLRALGWIRGRILPASNPSVSSTREPEASAPTSRPSAGWRNWLAERIARLLFRSGLASVVGHRQAKYLSTLLEMFEQGDLKNALHHAIPLGGEEGGFPKRPSLGVPSVRTHLDFLGARGRSDTALMVEDDLFSSLRRQYRRAFEQLVREGRIEEAVFVLAELLGEVAEAVQLLERNGRFRLAAELAEARELAPAQVIRQWILAGRWLRAFDIAQRHEAFAEAVALFERHREHEAAQNLRLLWADHLAERGDFGGAVEAVWPIEDARPLALRWIEAGLEDPGAVAARLLVRAIDLVPGSFARWRTYAESFLTTSEWSGPSIREALCWALSNARPTPELRALAKAALRALLADPPSSRFMIPQAVVDRLIRLADDPVFRADLPQRSKPPSPWMRTLHLEVDYLPSDRGSLAVSAVRPLSGGRLLVAAKEAGVYLLNAAGRKLAHFSEPADDLVISDHGHRAIALVRRGRVMRLARIDLVRRRAGFWCEIELMAWTRTFDGFRWFVADRMGMMALDVLKKEPTAIWRNGDCRAYQITRTEKTIYALASGEYEDEVWHFAVPELTLSRRQPCAVLESSPRRVVRLGPEGSVLALQDHPAKPNDDLPSARVSAVWLTNPGVTLLEFESRLGFQGFDLVFEHFGDWIVYSDDAVNSLVGFFVPEKQRVFEWRFSGAERVGVFHHGQALGLWDDCGRVMAIELRTGSIVSNIRLNP